MIATNKINIGGVEHFAWLSHNLLTVVLCDPVHIKSSQHRIEPQMLQKIWKPDTYIFNGRKSYLHTITTPNKFVRLFSEGRVFYSQR